MVSDQERNEFVAVLKHLGIFQPLSQYKAICPFHGDKNPSMLINIDECKFFCFGCQLHGGSYELIKYSYPSYNSFEIVREIKRAKIGSCQKKVDYEKVADKKLNMAAVRDYYYNLPEVNWYKVHNEPCKDYLKKRGFKMRTLNEAGARINATDAYKIVFPILDNGVFRGYVGRTIVKEIEEKRKYIYNTGFRRSKTLCGNYSGSSALVVEGFMDMLKARQNGVNSVVALLGWKMSEQQLNKLKHRGIKKIICGLDNDQAGENGYDYLSTLDCFDVVRLRYPEGIKDFGDVNEVIFNSKIRHQLEEYNLLEER